MNLPSNPLTDIIPASWRRYIYALLFVAGIVYGAFVLADGDWRKAIGFLVASVLGGLMPASNIHSPEVKGD